MEKAEELCRSRSAERTVVLTGAGISAESGIPTFRGKEGYWTVGSRVYQPMELATALGDRMTLVTQNVDGLHRRAGSPPARTYEIHGNIDLARCAAECTPARWPLGDDVGPLGRGEAITPALAARLVCPRCGGRARPHVLWFDEYYDEELYRAETAMRFARDAEVLVVVGTAGATNLPMQIGHAVLRSGAPIIDINTDDNPFAELAARSGGRAVQGSAATLLPALRAALGRP